MPCYYYVYLQKIESIFQFVSGILYLENFFQLHKKEGVQSKGNNYHQKLCRQSVQYDLNAATGPPALGVKISYGSVFWHVGYGMKIWSVNLSPIAHKLVMFGYKFGVDVAIYKPQKWIDLNCTFRLEISEVNCNIQIILKVYWLFYRVSSIRNFQ